MMEPWPSWWNHGHPEIEIMALCLGYWPFQFQVHSLRTKEKSNQLSTSSRGPSPLACLPSFSIAWGYSFLDAFLNAVYHSPAYSCLSTHMYVSTRCFIYVYTVKCLPYSCQWIYPRFRLLPGFPCVGVMRTFKIYSLGLKNDSSDKETQLPKAVLRPPCVLHGSAPLPDTRGASGSGSDPFLRQ